MTNPGSLWVNPLVTRGMKVGVSLQSVFVPWNLFGLSLHGDHWGTKLILPRKGTSATVLRNAEPGGERTVRHLDSEATTKIRDSGLAPGFTLIIRKGTDRGSTPGG